MKIKNIKNKKFSAEKALWLFETDGIESYIITHRNACDFPTWKYTLEETIEFLLEHGHRPCTYLQMIRIMNAFNFRIEELLEETLDWLEEEEAQSYAREEARREACEAMILPRNLIGKIKV